MIIEKEKRKQIPWVHFAFILYDSVLYLTLFHISKNLDM